MSKPYWLVCTNREMILTKDLSFSSYEGNARCSTLEEAQSLYSLYKARVELGVSRWPLDVEIVQFTEKPCQPDPGKMPESWLTVIRKELGWNFAMLEIFLKRNGGFLSDFTHVIERNGAKEDIAALISDSVSWKKLTLLRRESDLTAIKLAFDETFVKKVWPLTPA